MIIDKVSFVLENLEVIEISGDNVGTLSAAKFKDIIEKPTIEDHVMNGRICNQFIIEISKDANKKYDSFGRESVNYSFDRITKANDISIIEIDFDNGKHIEFYPVWTGENEYRNNAQESYISKTGNLYITISKKIGKKKKNIFNYFDKEIIDEKRMING